MREIPFAPVVQQQHKLPAVLRHQGGTTHSATGKSRPADYFSNFLSRTLKSQVPENEHVPKVLS